MKEIPPMELFVVGGFKEFDFAGVKK